ncbi:MBL fold metallo-hydrolase [Actinopolymorpha alba]|uniref:MBL fold metallo-hydrolase n=1 Tax=Actinopolymorpha alba TaxID=533267 RepID=UPI0003738AF9|nr:MBL fold metallo-hydrolase [Actinopolymorpha alba]
MAKAPATEIRPGVYRIPTAPWDLVNSYAFVDDDGQVTLVDTGTKAAPKKISAALSWIGSAPSQVTRIVLTHAHPDHAGGLNTLANETGADVVAHEADAPSLRSGRTPARDLSSFGGRLLERLPGGGFTPTEVAEEFVDGQVLDVGGGLEVVHTPGHSPGHVALLHHRSGILITGDSIFNVRGLRWSPAFFCTNFQLTKKTATRLAELDYEVAAFTHGPQITDGPRDAIRDFLRRERVATD